MTGKSIRVNGGRGDDELQIGPPGQNLAQVAQQEIDVEAALVCFIDDQRVIGLQQGVALGFRQQDAVRHQFDRRLAAQTVLEANLVAHHLPQ